MLQMDWGNVLKFENDSEYYETLGFLCKDEKIVRVYIENNDKAGAWAAQGRMYLKNEITDCLPRALAEAFNTSRDGRISETKYVRNLRENHAFTQEVDPTGNEFTKRLYKVSIESVIETVPEERRLDFYRGYYWNCEVVKRTRNLRIEDINYDYQSEQDSSDGRTEGRKKKYYTTKYERNSKNRQEAIRIHGTKCMICDFDFEKVYGELGKNYIEVHHIKPLASLDEETNVDPKTELICVCANCHGMLHRFKSYIISIEELKIIVEDNKKKESE